MHLRPMMLSQRPGVNQFFYQASQRSCCSLRSVALLYRDARNITQLACRFASFGRTVPECGDHVNYPAVREIPMSSRHKLPAIHLPGDR